MLIGCLAAGLSVQNLRAQNLPVPDPAIPVAPQPPVTAADDEGRVMGVIPNNKIVSQSDPSTEPLTTAGKFHLALKDTTDPFTLVFAGFVSGLTQWRNDYPGFGQGSQGYGKRFGAAYADQVVGNYLSEAIVPSLLHQDPRYFRKGTGGVGARLSYALTRTLITRNDRGKRAFNYSEIVGNAAAAGLSTSYYPASQRTAGETAEKFGLQVVSDSAFNVLIEFWPEMRHAILRK